MCLYKCLDIWVYSVILRSFVGGRTVYLEYNTPTTDQITYLRRYGYLPEVQMGDQDAATYTALSLSTAVRKMQAFAGLPQTGILDAVTKSLFDIRRCGVKDMDNFVTRLRRYILQQGWSKKHITYRILNGASTLDKDRVEVLVDAALAIWAPHGGLHFTKVQHQQADIELSFSNGDHGDGFPFDGLGHVVAHAYSPPNGAIHFDDDELWTDNPDDPNVDATNFFAVVTHEIGHTLGLSHSDVKSSVMYPYYQRDVDRLDNDDIMGMHELYFPVTEQSAMLDSSLETTLLPRSSSLPRFTKASNEEYEDYELPDLCFTNYDTMQVLQGKIYVFEEEWVWVFTERKKLEAGYPKKYHEVFRGLPKNIKFIKTIYEKRNGNIAIFYRRKYWEFNKDFFLVKKGRLTDYAIPPRVPELSTVFVSNYNNKTYLVEYERFWRFDEDTNSMDKGYPKEMSAWRDVPYPVDAAFVWKGDTFFFRGPRFWRFDNKLVRAHENYPLPTAQIWFPCEETPDIVKYIVNEEP